MTCKSEHFNMAIQRAIPNIHFTVQSGTFAARDASAMLMDQLAPLDLDVEEAGTVELVMAEALNNIVEHGYPDPENGGPITITCKHGTKGLNIKLVDYGLPMPDGKTPVGLAVNLDVDFMEIPEGGFGWFIIKDLAKDIVYTRFDRENRLDLRIAIGIEPRN